MANHEFFYFYSPTWDYPPGGPIQLGNVISSVQRPHRILDRILPQDTDIFSTEKTKAQYDKEKARNGKFSMWARFLSLFGIGIKAEMDKKTEGFVQTQSYNLKCINSANVCEFLREHDCEKPVYVITGIKVASGAKGKTIQDRNIGGGLTAQANGTALSGGGVPVDLGLDASGRKGDNVVTQWDGGSDFVFAYRVSRITVTDLEEQKFHDEGAMLGNEWEQPEGPTLSILKVDGPDAETEGFDTEELMEDDDKVTCAIFRK